jgi:hypothetical protein
MYLMLRPSTLVKSVLFNLQSFVRVVGRVGMAWRMRVPMVDLLV